MRNFKELKVWEKAHRLTLEVYKVTASFPKDELCGLTSPIRRAAASVPANIAEGCGREGSKALLPFLHYAIGSGKELEFQLELAALLGYSRVGEMAVVRDLAARTVRMLIRLSDVVRQRAVRPRLSSRPTSHAPPS